MRKIGIVIALITAGTLGSIGFAGAAWADGHEETLCPVVNDVTDGVAGVIPADDTAEGAHQTCLQSNLTAGIVAGPLVCGVTQDIEDEINADLAAGIDGLREDLEQGGLNGPPLDLTGCGPDTTEGCVSNCGGAGGGGGGGGDAAVQAASAGADGGLPRTGAELFAGAGFALMSLGALVRRFLS